MPLPISLGLCCLNTELRTRKPTIFNSRTCTRKTFTVPLAKKRALLNIADMHKMMEYNDAHSIRCFRLSSNIYPHFTDDVTESYTIDFSVKELELAGETSRRCKQRLLMHPGQYNQVGANTDRVFEKTVEDLSHHADILDAMGVGDEGVLIVHGGGMYGDKFKTVMRWINNFKRLPPKVRRRLVLENCEKCYSLSDVLVISDTLREDGHELPVVFDSHHYECYEQLHPDEEPGDLHNLMKRVVESWGSRRPLMHISNQGTGRVGHHSDYITRVPDIFRYVAEELNVDFDLEVEAKMKEKAIFKMRSDFPELFMLREE